VSRVAAIVLAAGTASRYRAADPSVPTKLVASIDGVPMVRRVVEAALASRARPVVVVTGHAGPDVRAALEGLSAGFVANPDYATGMASSLAAALSALPTGVDGALVLLGDMPGVTAPLLDRLIEAHSADPDRDAVVPMHGGRRGNPVLLGRVLFGAAMELHGDEGARRLLVRAQVLEVDVTDRAVLVDVDDPATLASLGLQSH
jgi:molybdenum cofactor cytidylyltransferase